MTARLYCTRSCSAASNVNCLGTSTWDAVTDNRGGAEGVLCPHAWGTSPQQETSSTERERLRCALRGPDGHTPPTLITLITPCPSEVSRIDNRSRLLARAHGHAVTLRDGAAHGLSGTR